MRMHVICNFGEGDSHDPGLPATEPRIVLGLRSGQRPSNVKESVYQSLIDWMGYLPDGVCLDLLNLGLAVYSADQSIPRDLAEDGWQRHIKLHFPVTDLPTWTTALPAATRTLSFLTGDHWEIELRSRDADDPPDGTTDLTPVDCVSLFSGGLDSLAGVLHLLDGNDRVALVGHYGPGMTHTFQQNVLETLETHYGGHFNPHLFWVAKPTLAEGNLGDNNMRARSILFLALGVTVANCYGQGTTLHVPENGLISLNVPFTPARSGSLSTRTTHPHFIELFRELLQCLSINTPIDMLYRFRTKGELLQVCPDQIALRELTPLTMSCSHPEAGRYAGHSPGTHCGYCVPCLIRRAAVDAAGLPDAPYIIDAVQSPPDAKLDKGQDVRALLMAIHRFRGDSSRRRNIRAVLSSGPIPPHDIGNFADVYGRGMEELADLFGI